jgi:hypothetical protein
MAIAGNLLSPETSTTFDDSSIDGLAILRVALIIAGIAVVGALLALTIQLAMLHVLVQRATGQPVSISAALGGGLRRVPAMLGWGILQILLILLGFLLCLLPGFYVVIALYILPAVVLLERGQGIGRAFKLFHADFGASIARVATIGGLGLAFAMVENAFTSLIGGGFVTDEPLTVPLAVAAGIVSVAIWVASAIVLAPMLLTAYADMRARREPFSTAYLTPDPHRP